MIFNGKQIEIYCLGWLTRHFLLIFTGKRLLYRILKFCIRPALFIFCRKLFISDPSGLKEKGPLLIACNHPNSFLDAVILDLLFEQPVWSLARGDVFKNNYAARILRSLKILPVYRTSEGVENLTENYKTFEACIDIFRKNGIVLIFSEGKCINEWHLRPLKKGTARLAARCWDENIPLRVLPAGINYSSFRRFGKNIYLRFGQVITAESMPAGGSDGMRHLAFNRRLQEELRPLVLEIPLTDKAQQQEKLAVSVPAWKKWLLSLPAALGYLFHWPLYRPLRLLTLRRTRDNDHYDSVLIALLLVSYPLYLLMLTALAWLIVPTTLVFLLPLLLLFSAWCFVQLKPQLDR